MDNSSFHTYFSLKEEEKISPLLTENPRLVVVRENLRHQYVSGKPLYVRE